jgi:pantoate--beta-alanine ligase
MTELVRTRGELDRARRRLTRPIGLVPTMGALHAGHASLFDASRRAGDDVVVSLFVNRYQFGDPADLAAYPRPLESDLAIAEAHGVALVFAPSEEEMYPLGRPVVHVEAGPLGEVLEGVSRPGHFTAVATVVTKLLALVAPTRAYFGEKDYQQLTIVRRLVADLSIPVEIVGCPTVREPDGLAMSSRNGRLSPKGHAAALTLHRALAAAVAACDRPDAVAADAERAMVDEFACTPEVRLDYAVVVRASDLSRADRLDGPLRVLVAAEVDGVRLIDNVGVDR